MLNGLETDKSPQLKVEFLMEKAQMADG